MSRTFVCLFLLCMTVPFTSQSQQQEVVVAAAADLKFAMDSIITIFAKNNPDLNIKVVYGSSGNFFQQISNGAPFDLYFSADIDYPRQLKEKGLTLSPIQLYGT